MIIVGLEEAQFFYLVSKRVKPKASRLFKPIKSFKEHQDLAMVTIVKKLGLLNVNFFPKLGIEECCYCVTLVGMQTVFCSNGKKGFVGCGFNNGGEGLKIINSFLLLKAFSNPSYFILLDISIDISLALKSLFVGKNMLIFWAVNKYLSTISQ